MIARASVVDDVRRAVAAVSDPEFPGVTIADLGMLEDVREECAGRVIVDLIPTFLGCPALGVIEEDVAAAARLAAPDTTVEVRFVAEPAWTIERITPAGRRKLAEMFTVGVPASGEVACPVCGAADVVERSPFGPTRCRAVGYCSSCMNPVEVMRT